MAYAKKFIEENGIKNRCGLQKTDKSLYELIRKRNLLDDVILGKMLRDWSSTTDKELIIHAKKFIEENGIKNRKGLEKADLGLYKVLIRRNLLGAVILGKMLRDWSSMTDDELISLVKTFIKENKIKNRKSLAKADSGLYFVLRKRNLLDTVIPEKQEYRDWSSIPDKELLSYAKKFIEENTIKNRSGLQKADCGLCNILRKRNLLDAAIPEKRDRRKPRSWSSMTDDELVSYAKTYIKENAIKSRRGLEKADRGLYEILRKRNLLASVIPKKRKLRGWSSMSGEELISHAKTFIEENAIKNRSGLEKADHGLYQVLWRRKLLSAVFSDIEHAKKTEAVKQVFDAMKEFGGSE